MRERKRQTDRKPTGASSDPTGAVTTCCIPVLYLAVLSALSPTFEDGICFPAEEENIKILDKERLRNFKIPIYIIISIFKERKFKSIRKNILKFGELKLKRKVTDIKCR